MMEIILFIIFSFLVYNLSKELERDIFE